MTSGYRFGPLLARGGTGVVHLATDRLGREVAVKRLALTGTAAEIETARRRIRREAEMLAAVDHPSIVPLLAVEDDGPDLLLVMPYLPGGSLADHVRRFGPMAPSGLDRLAPPLLDAVAAAHARGIVHRDISPGNILFDAGGRPVLADFGVATSRVHTAGLTRAGWTIGTPGFMSPEQARGEPAGPADAAHRPAVPAAALPAVRGDAAGRLHRRHPVRRRTRRLRRRSDRRVRGPARFGRRRRAAAGPPAGRQPGPSRRRRHLPHLRDRPLPAVLRR